MPLPYARGPNLTLHQIRIVWTVAHAQTVSRAAKQLGLSQSSLSQQIGKLEASIGQKLFERQAGRMQLTELGTFLVDNSEQVIRDVQMLEDGLSSFAGGAKTISIASISSPLRVLLPRALRRFHAHCPDVGLDLHESGPEDVLAMLHARRANVGIVSTSSIAAAGMSFVRVPLFDDPYVLVVPETLSLEGQLEAAQRATLNNVIHFVYGTQHQKRIEAWYDTNLPGHRVVARCRSFEVAVALVRSGMGVCLAPALSCFSGENLLGGIRLHQAELGLPRPLVALVPSQYRHLPPYSTLVETLQEEARNHFPPHIDRWPSFLPLR